MFLRKITCHIIKFHEIYASTILHKFITEINAQIISLNNTLIQILRLIKEKPNHNPKEWQEEFNDCLTIISQHNIPKLIASCENFCEEINNRKQLIPYKNEETIKIEDIKEEIANLFKGDLCDLQNTSTEETYYSLPSTQINLHQSLENIFKIEPNHDLI